MANKTTLETLDKKFDERFARLEQLMERGFAAVAEDISKLATKDQVIALHAQVNAIETDIRTMKQTKLEVRVADLEDKVYGHTRARAAR